MAQILLGTTRLCWPFGGPCPLPPHHPPCPLDTYPRYLSFPPAEICVLLPSPSHPSTPPLRFTSVSLYPGGAAQVTGPLSITSRSVLTLSPLLLPPLLLPRAELELQLGGLTGKEEQRHSLKGKLDALGLCPQPPPPVAPGMSFCLI